jgi:hypothetical protein
MISPPQSLLHIQTHKKWIKNKQTISERQDELLVIAEQLVTEQGFANFTMDKLTAHSSYSKGTIYNHFNSKEGNLERNRRFNCGIKHQESHHRTGTIYCVVIDNSPTPVTNVTVRYNVGARQRFWWQ